MNIAQAISQLDNYFQNKYKGSKFSFTLKGSINYEFNTHLIVYAASALKIAYGLYFIENLNKNNIKTDTLIPFKLSNSLLKHLYNLIIKKESVEAFILELYSKLNQTDKEKLHKLFYLLDNNKPNFSSIIEEAQKIILPDFTFKELMELIFAKSSNDSLDILVEYYQTIGIKLQDEVQKLVDLILGEKCNTVINNSYKENGNWNISTLPELIDLLKRFIEEGEKYPFLIESLRIVANSYLEYNCIENRFLEKSGWYPNFPLLDKDFFEQQLIEELGDEQKLATFALCVGYDESHNIYYAYSLAVPHSENIGEDIIQEEGPYVTQRTVEFI